MPESKSAQPTPNDEKVSLTPHPALYTQTSSSHLLYANIQDPQQHPQQHSDESFEFYYLRQVTAEFADDIDKIRNASDFNERSVAVLVQALKGSGANFTEEERGRVMGARG